MFTLALAAACLAAFAVGVIRGARGFGTAVFLGLALALARSASPDGSRG